ncbi:MAG TPA: Ldh family oxidoreductase [Chloroflexota bacterium]|nr:Ldh family oxidoreductase [Chloroflexota bacterium]
MLTISARRLTDVATSIFTAAGATPENAQGVVSSLVDANLAGHDSHGVIRISAYVKDIREGRLDPKATPVVVRETASTAVIDGGTTFGQVSSRMAADLAIRKARAASLAAVAANHCHHTGRIGEWTERVAAAGLVGMATTAGPRGPQSVAPFGGAKGALGTNPMSWAIPRAAGHPPVLMDYATSAVAQGKLQVARAKQEPVPDGCIIDAAGKPTNNVEDFFAGGLLLPFAGHKGYALSVVVELLSVGLSAGDKVPAGERAGTVLMVAIDPGAFRPAEEFTKYVESVVARLKAIPPAPGFSEVLVPGEPEARTRATRQREGIPVPERTWEGIEATARELGLSVAA